MRLDSDTLASCRERGGDALDDRDASIEAALNQPQLGWQEGQPLAADSYDSYPSRKDLARPEYGDFLERLLGHELVGDEGDAVAELTGANDRGTLSDWVRTVTEAAAIHGLSTDSLFEGGGQEGGSALTAVLDYQPPADMLTADNPLLISELYVIGLSVGEIAEVLEKEVDGSVNSAAVSDTLKDVGLVEGKTRDEQRESFEEKDSRLGGVTIDNTGTATDGDSRGLTVNAENFA